jgi:RNA polymerase sigma-70 factor (ECF subfamily)
LVATLEQVFREEWGRVLATLIGFLGDFDLAGVAALEAARDLHALLELAQAAR